MSQRLFRSFATLAFFAAALGACTGSPLGNDDFDCSDSESQNYEPEMCEAGIVIVGSGG